MTVLEDLVAQIAEAETNAAAWKTLADDLKKRLRAAMPHKGDYTVGNYSVKIASNRRWDEALAMTLVPTELHPAVLEQKLVSTINRKKLETVAPALAEQCYTVYDNRVTIK